MPGDVEAQHCRRQPLLSRGSGRRAVVRPGRDVHGPAHRQASSFAMWNLHGIEPEAYDYRRRRIIQPGYALRPEIVESTWYLYRLTGEAQYRAMGRKLFEDFVRYCRTESAYAALADVTTKAQADDMESFVMAETFKYFYLLFAPPATLDPRQVVLSTEAHPLRRTWPAK